MVVHCGLQRTFSKTSCPMYRVFSQPLFSQPLFLAARSLTTNLQINFSNQLYSHWNLKFCRILAIIFLQSCTAVVQAIVLGNHYPTASSKYGVFRQRFYKTLTRTTLYYQLFLLALGVKTTCLDKRPWTANIIGWLSPTMRTLSIGD